MTLNTTIPFAGSAISRQARRLYVGNIPFGVTEVWATTLDDSTLKCHFLHSQYVFASLAANHDGFLQQPIQTQWSGAGRRKPGHRLSNQLGQKLCFLGG